MCDKEDPDNLIYCLLRNIHQQMPRPLTYVLNRSYAHENMLRHLFKFEQDLIIRWKNNHLPEHPTKGVKKTHLLARSFQRQSSLGKNLSSADQQCAVSQPKKTPLAIATEVFEYMLSNNFP